VTGECVLEWSIVARDGHRTRGELLFRVPGR
jgi:methionine-rich copper-binding protein CopC